MKKLSALLFAAAFMAFLLAGCDQRDPDLVGSWEIDGDPGWVSTFNDDGQGSHTEDWGYGLTFQWSTSGGRINWRYPGHPRLYTNYRIVGNSLYITLYVDDGDPFEVRLLRR